MLHIEQLQAAYKAGHMVLKGVNLTLQVGEKHGILGANGAGKTTLFHTIAGWTPAQGQVNWAGQAITRQQVAILEAEPYFYPYMTAREYLYFLHPDEATIRWWCQLFDLPEQGYADDFSTGMKKKLALSGVLMQQERPIVILDEPFNGVDFESAERIIAILNQPGLLGGRTVLIASHLLHTLTRVCDRISVLRDGIIERSYTPEAYEALDQQIRERIELEIAKGIVDKNTQINQSQGITQQNL
jgi:ABC-2 type transport system ATP-binding protein